MSSFTSIREIIINFECDEFMYYANITLAMPLSKEFIGQSSSFGKPIRNIWRQFSGKIRLN